MKLKYLNESEIPALKNFSEFFECEENEIKIENLEALEELVEEETEEINKKMERYDIVNPPKQVG